MTKVWVTGSLGMLATAVMAELEKKAIAAIGTDKSDLNITDLSSVEQFCQQKQITHIINCAAYTDVDGAEKEIQVATLVNVKGPENLAIVAKKTGARLVHFSTDYVFSGASTKPYVETDICVPCNVYGQTKFEGEQRVIKAFPDACIIRTSWLFGLHGKNFLSKMLEIMQKKTEVFVVADQIGRPTFCHDLAEVAVSLMSHRGIFHFANSGSTSWYELTLSLFEEAKALGFDLRCTEIKPTTSKEYKTDAVRPSYSVLDTQKIEGVLGLKPRSWQLAMKAYITEYFRTLCQ